MEGKPVMTKATFGSGLAFIALAVWITVVGAGCAGVSTATVVTPANAAQTSAAKDDPRVQDCGIVSVSSPMKYVCGGKVYTSFQLAKIREEARKKYESGN
jgi:hypothetical protein